MIEDMLITWFTVLVAMWLGAYFSSLVTSRHIISEARERKALLEFKVHWWPFPHVEQVTTTTDQGA